MIWHLVVKAVQKSRTTMPLDDIEQEILIMRQVDHPHVVRLFEWYEDDRAIYLVLEALKGGTLKEVVLLLQRQNKGLRESWARKVCRQAADGLSYCHQLRLIHKDLKDENIMLLKKDPDFDEPFAVIIDLGMAEMFSSADPVGRIFGGTPLTMAPEVWIGRFGPKCDVFSLGVIMYELLAGSYPFMSATMSAEGWCKLHRRGPDWSKFHASKQGKALCRSMLAYSEKDRPTMQECCQHAWFKVDKQGLKRILPAQFEGFATFCQQEYAKRSLLLEIASRLPIGQAGMIVQIFETLDVDRDGTLSLAELKNFFQQMGIDDPALAERTFKALDADEDGSLTFTEFSAGALLLFKDKLEDSLFALFQRHDSNRDGMLDHTEAKSFLDAALEATSFSPTGARSSEVDRLLLKSKSGNIPFEDLRKYMFGSSKDSASSASSSRSSTSRRSRPRSAASSTSLGVAK